MNFRDELILSTVAEWIKADPKSAAEFAIQNKMEKQAQVHKSGAWRGTKLGYVKWRIPQVLLDCIRLVLNHYNIDELFGLDDKDMKLIARNFPDLFGKGMNIDYRHKRKEAAVNPSKGHQVKSPEKKISQA